MYILSVLINIKACLFRQFLGHKLRALLIITTIDVMVQKLDVYRHIIILHFYFDPICFQSYIFKSMVRVLFSK